MGYRHSSRRSSGDARPFRNRNGTVGSTPISAFRTLKSGLKTARDAYKEGLRHLHYGI